MIRWANRPMLAPNTMGEFLLGALCLKASKDYSFLTKTKRRIIGTRDVVVNDRWGVRAFVRPPDFFVSPG
jgi:hypothetical protein